MRKESMYLPFSSQKIKYLFFSLALTLAFSPLMIFAQSASGVTGVVTDASGLLLPGVEVKLKDTKTSREQTATTNDQGIYTFNNIQPGAGYTLSFSKQGFQTYSINEVQLSVAKSETYNAQMKVGQVTETVQVTSTTGDASLNTTDASLGNVIGTRQLRELPIQIRNSPAALIGLQPGAVGNNIGAGNAPGFGGAQSNRVGSITGARADQGNITVDGIDSNDQAGGFAFLTVGNAAIDSVQEFRAVTAIPGANEGRSSGGQIQIVTKSGTNEFHGSLREYNRTAATAANTFFNNKAGLPKRPLVRNQFGGSIGGPLPFFNFGEGGPMFSSGKDKLFFFFDYEGWQNREGFTYTRTVPLQSFREGRLAYLNGATGCSSLAVSTIRQTSNSQCISYLSPAEIAAIDPLKVGVNQAFLSFINSRYPLPNDLSLGDGINTGGIRFNAPAIYKENNYTTRIDFNLSATQKLFGRFTIVRREASDVVNADREQQFPGDKGGPLRVDKSYSWVVGHSWNMSPSVFNKITIGSANQRLDFPNTTEGSSFPNSYTIAGLSNPFASISTQARNINTPTLANELTWNTGNHTFVFGGMFKPIRSEQTLVSDLNFVSINGSSLSSSLRPATLRPGSTTNYDRFFQVLLGRISQINTNFVYDPQGKALPLGSGRVRNYVYDEFELYAQDNWRVRSDLNLNFGVRWQYYAPPFERDGFQGGNSVDYEPLINLRIRNAANGISGDDAEPLSSFNLIGKANNGRSIYKSDKNNFAPRIGFAYNPAFERGILGAIFGNRKTSIRGGAALVYDRTVGAITFIQDQNSYIFDNSKSSLFFGGSPQNLIDGPRFTGATTLPVQNAAPVSSRPFVPDPNGFLSGEFSYGIAENFETPFSYQFSVSIQRELPGNFLLDVGWVNRKGRKLITQADAAQTLNFRDKQSGQLMFDALNRLQAEMNSNSPITTQPWFDNQLNPTLLNNYGGTCQDFGYSSCSDLMANFFGFYVQNGSTSDLIYSLYSNGFIDSNVGMSRQWGSNAYITNLGNSDYNGMLLSLQKRFSKGLEFDFNYTWSHSLDNQSSVTNTITGGLLCDVTNPNACRGNSDFDIRHLVNFNGIYDIPIGRGKFFGNNMPKWLDSIIGDWSVSGIFVARSGLALNSTSGIYPTSYLLNSPAILNGDLSALRGRIHDEGTGIQYFDDPIKALAAFRNPKHGETGSRNIFRGPTFFNTDMAVSKKFKLPWSENQRLTFRAEAYNVFNSNSFDAPDLNIASPTFGRITRSLTSPREIQFALRFDF
jgi:hypothetical protein